MKLFPDVIRTRGATSLAHARGLRHCPALAADRVALEDISVGMLQRLCNDIVALRHRCISCSWAKLLLCALALAACKVHAQTQEGGGAQPAGGPDPSGCLPNGDGYLRARLAGAVRAELDWGNDGLECTGAVRPTDGGIRLRFSRGSSAKADTDRLVLVFGAKLSEGKSARMLPVNLTIMREGAGEFFSTQGDDKCTLEEVTQQPIVGVPRRSRVYRVVVRGFCTEPARAVRGQGAVLASRFDFAGRVDYEEEVTSD